MAVGIRSLAEPEHSVGDQRAPVLNASMGRDCAEQDEEEFRTGLFASANCDEHCHCAGQDGNMEQIRISYGSRRRMVLLDCVMLRKEHI